MQFAIRSAALRRATCAGAAIALGLAALPQPARAQSGDWQAEWKAVVAAANKEGRVNCGCPQHPGSRKYLMAQWQKDYPNITLEFTPAVLPEWAARVEAERSAGKYLWDTYFSGPGPAIYKMAHEKVLDPLVPALILPDVKDPKTWGGWENAFFDNEKKRMLAMWSDVSTPWFNAKIVPPEKVKKEGLKVLLDPAYKNKIVWWDPRYGGAGINYAYMLYVKYGEKGLRTALVDQNATILHDTNSMTERMVRGTAAFSLGPDLAETLIPYQKAGIPLDLRRMGDTPEVAMLSTGYGIAAIFNRPPHPNAAKLFMNWLLSKPIQTGLAKSAKNDSRRIDVPQTPGAPPRPLPGMTYLSPQMEKDAHERVKVMMMARKMRPQ